MQPQAIIARDVHNLRMRLQEWEASSCSGSEKSLVDSMNAAIDRLKDHIQSENAHELVQFGAVPVLVLVFYASLSDSASRRNVLHFNLWTLKAMVALRELVAISPSAAAELINSRTFVLKAFECMAENLLFMEASSLIEELVAVSGIFIDLTTIPDIEGLLMRLLPHSAACMCRLIGLVVFDPEDRMHVPVDPLNADGLIQQRLRICRQESLQTICDRNVALLMRVPVFLHRLCTLVIHKMTNATSHWMENVHLLGVAQLEQLLSSLVEPAWQRVHGNIDDEPIESTEDFNSDQLQLLTQRVEVLFVICTLLSSKRKLDAQRHFVDGKLIDSLVHIMRRITWNHPPPAVSPMHQLHGHGCECFSCKAESSLRIQLLQLVMNMCEVDSESASLKASLITRDECIAVQHGLDAGIFNGRELAEVPPASWGLVHLILIEFVHPQLEQNYRYWMSSVIESFLRGSIPLHQAMVAQAGILSHVCKSILDETSQSVHGLQSSFDLLGEIIKFNPALVLQLELTLGRDGSDNLTRICSSHLVESNMFLRSLLLTLRYAQAHAVLPNSHRPFSMGNASMHFCDSAAASAALSCIEKSALCSWLNREEHVLLYNLMTAVKEQDLRTENICVLNTALCMLMFKRLDNTLCGVLQDVFHHEETNGVAGCATGNYRTLLQFWRRYYALKGRDSSMLHLRCVCARIYTCVRQCACVLICYAFAAPDFRSLNGLERSNCFSRTNHSLVR
jgi:Trpc4-associated protein